MSLFCHESKNYITFGDPLFAGTRKDAKFFSALCEDVINKIPEKDRNKKPCDPIEGGIDIHRASSTLNLTGTYTLCDFTIEEFIFSVSRETSKKYLPELLKLIDKIVSIKPK